MSTTLVDFVSGGYPSRMNKAYTAGVSNQFECRYQFTSSDLTPGWCRVDGMTATVSFDNNAETGGKAFNCDIEYSLDGVNVVGDLETGITVPGIPITFGQDCCYIRPSLNSIEGGTLVVKISGRVGS